MHEQLFACTKYLFEWILFLFWREREREREAPKIWMDTMNLNGIPCGLMLHMKVSILLSTSHNHKGNFPRPAHTKIFVVIFWWCLTMEEWIKKGRKYKSDPRERVSQCSMVPIHQMKYSYSFGFVLHRKEKKTTYNSFAKFRPLHNEIGATTYSYLGLRRSRRNAKYLRACWNAIRNMKGQFKNTFLKQTLKPYLAINLLDHSCTCFIS